MSTPEDQPGPRDAAYWAKRVERLEVTGVPEGAINRNVTGRRVVSPIQGFGRMWQKTYQVALAGTSVSPQQVVAAWKRHFPSFWPEGNRFYAPLTGIAPGEVAVINATLPGKTKLSTGVFVLYADEESFTFMTPEGHGLAGWITFSAFEREGTTVAQAHILMRASDPLSELGLALGMHKQEDLFWQHTLTALAAHFGVEGQVATEVVCVDRKRQWAKVGNLRHNAVICSQIFALGAPFRRRGGWRDRERPPGA